MLRCGLQTYGIGRSALIPACTGVACRATGELGRRNAVVASIAMLLVDGVASGPASGALNSRRARCENSILFLAPCRLDVIIGFSLSPVVFTSLKIGVHFVNCALDMGGAAPVEVPPCHSYER
jgi:hypothetical protein